MPFDFIVIGSGLAGLTSALVLSKWGRVVIITKGSSNECATSWAQGGIACVVGEKDSASSHSKDTLVAGAFHNKKRAVEFLVQHASTAISWLESQGVAFDKQSSGGYSVGLEGGHSFPRILHATDFTGKIVEDALIKKVQKNQVITIWEKTLALELLVNEGVCHGVQVQQGNEVENIFARVVVLATGGLGQLYQWTTNPTVATGDGIAMAARARTKLSDLEFIQFHPTALKHGLSPLFLLSEALRGEGAYLKKGKISRKSGIHDAVITHPPAGGSQTASGQNSKFKIKNIGQERFMQTIHPRGELAPRDIVTRAIVAEQYKGYEVYLDIRHKGEKFLKARFPNIYRELQVRGYNLVSDLIPVTPAAHYSCGGVVVDLYGRTSVKNLFAFGEVACSGVHGANRLASNSLLEAVVFPLQLPHIINQLPKSPVIARKFTLRSPDVGRGDEGWQSSPEINSLKKQLQKLMWEHVGVVRSKEGLKHAHTKIKQWEREAPQLNTMLLTARLIVEAALKRPKSLGAHFMS